MRNRNIHICGNMIQRKLYITEYNRECLASMPFIIGRIYCYLLRHRIKIKIKDDNLFSILLTSKKSN